jgi:hypothetical protein
MISSADAKHQIGQYLRIAANNPKSNCTGAPPPDVLNSMVTVGRLFTFVHGSSANPWQLNPVTQVNKPKLLLAEVGQHEFKLFLDYAPKDKSNQAPKRTAEGKALTGFRYNRKDESGNKLPPDSVNLSWNCDHGEGNMAKDTVQVPNFLH